MGSLIIFVAGGFAALYFFSRYRNTEEGDLKKKYGIYTYIGLVLILGEVYFRVVEAFPDGKFLALIIAVGILYKATDLFRKKKNRK